MFSFKKKEQKNPITFTYYIPAPPKRKTGYQEREFDQVISTLTENHFKLKRVTTQSHSANDASGIWVICELIPLKASCTNFNFDRLKQEFEPEQTVELE